MNLCCCYLSDAHVSALGIHRRSSIFAARVYLRRIQEAEVLFQLIRHLFRPPNMIMMRNLIHLVHLAHADHVAQWGLVHNDLARSGTELQEKLIFRLILRWILYPLIVIVTQTVWMDQIVTDIVVASSSISSIMLYKWQKVIFVVVRPKILALGTNSNKRLGRMDYGARKVMMAVLSQGWMCDGGSGARVGA
ncbi:hypothetical protein BUALT_Bualt19G0066600 [Buddleja alternifolia]|uniref:Uncharacterized protein n=1 Tax=Buddleja alternifolia TaxID=168488 RepID=A0AAV6W1Z7_9LAMI|nr:hypothetical protein BUALT_Bualt19G0066600 [Buddleja alternifolia]